MYAVTVDVALPAEALADRGDQVGAELERLALAGAAHGPVRRLRTVVSPAGVIFAITVDCPTSEAALQEADALVSRALSGFTDWKVVSSDVWPEQASR